MHMHISLFYVAIQLLRTIISATFKLPVGTAPTSPSPGTLWMATTPPATSDTSICFTSAGAIYLLTQCPSLTAQQPTAVPPSGTPTPWTPLNMDPTSCGCGWTDLP